MNTRRSILIVITVLLSTACINMASKPERPAVEQTLSVSLQVPDMGWSVKILSVYETADELWVISRLKRHPGPAAHMISTVSDQVTVSAPELPVRYFVLGKTWAWENSEEITFIKDQGEIEAKLGGARRIYQATATE